MWKATQTNEMILLIAAVSNSLCYKHYFTVPWSWPGPVSGRRTTCHQRSVKTGHTTTRRTSHTYTAPVKAKLTNRAQTNTVCPLLQGYLVSWLCPVWTVLPQASSTSPYSAPATSAAGITPLMCPCVSSSHCSLRATVFTSWSVRSAGGATVQSPPVTRTSCASWSHSSLRFVFRPDVVQ